MQKLATELAENTEEKQMRSTRANARSRFSVISLHSQGTIPLTPALSHKGRGGYFPNRRPADQPRSSVVAL